MRRTCSHRLTGSVPRLLTAAAVAVIGAAGLVTVASAPGTGGAVSVVSAPGSTHGVAFLLPLFLLLDVIAAGAVVIAVRKSWSKTGVD